MLYHARVISSQIEQRSQFFARRKGRPLSGAQGHLMETVLPQLAYDENAPFPPSHLRVGEDPVDPRFRGEVKRKDCKKLIFEFGFGKGEAMLHRLATDPEACFIGTEVFQNSLAWFLTHLPEGDRDRVRIHPDDGFPLLAQLPDASLDEIWLLNPDPWHKKRHWKRRFVQTERLRDVVRLLKPNGIFFTTTDVPPLAAWTIEHLIQNPDFEWMAESKADWETPPANWVPTSYELKGAKGSEKMSYLKFQKIC